MSRRTVPLLPVNYAVARVHSAMATLREAIQNLDVACGHEPPFVATEELVDLVEDLFDFSQLLGSDAEAFAEEYDIKGPKPGSRA